MIVKFKKRLKMNLMSLFLIAVSFTSVTLAWFAYSGIANTSLEVNVKAWNIELEKNGEIVTHDIVISLTDIYPGMDLVDEIVKITNLGDSDAEVTYSIISARILDNPNDDYLIDDIITSDYVEDKLSHDYPFKINMSLSKNFALAKGDESYFEVSVSWPLDSGDDLWDSQWGTKAYDFQVNEENKLKGDSSYQTKSAIQIVISLSAVQYLETSTSSDLKYAVGEEVIFDTENNKRCSSLSDSPNCIITTVLDVNNLLGMHTVSLLPNTFNSYQNGAYDDYTDIHDSITASWNVVTRSLAVNDILKIIALDVKNSVLVRDSLSNSVIGNLRYNSRLISEIEKVKISGGHYRFDNDRFSYITSTSCYWLQSEFSATKGFAVKRLDDYSQVYGEIKTSTCKVIPVIVAEKSNLN